jgi:hypothetical protein
VHQRDAGDDSKLLFAMISKHMDLKLVHRALLILPRLDALLPKIGSQGR